MIKAWSTFSENKLNPFDVMVMASQEEADKVIEKAKKEIDLGIFSGSIDTDETVILENDEKRIEQEIKQYLKNR